ncbi:MAG: PBECR2 nuclease fold domain-containing protein [Terriglobia bacterium]
MEIVSPPPVLTFFSLADLLEQYERLLVGRNLRSPRGIQVVFEPYHFFHLVKLRKGHQTEFLMSQEREAILATRNGFGEFEIDQRRAETLPWILDLIQQPHEIYEYTSKRTADEVFIKEYLKSGSPFKVLLVVREEDYLKPVTSLTVRRPAIKEHRRGKLLWPRKESHSG